MIQGHDREILRNLAHEVAEIAHLPIMQERRELWKKHNSLKPVRPMILVFPEGSWRELLPQDSLLCEDSKAREIEWQLRSRIYYHHHIPDDTVIEGSWTVNKFISDTGWGLEPHYIPSTADNGAWGFDPVILTREDLKKLQYPQVLYDEAASRSNLEETQELFGDILEVRQKGISHISFHLMSIYCRLRGLEQVMLDMYDEPEMLHEAMSFLEEGSRGLIRQYQEMNLLSLNNDDTYHSSGGVSYTEELPKEDFNPNRVRLCDMWASAESQEMAQVSPAMHEEFAMQYERRLLEPFGLNGYGCCEDLTRKLDNVFRIPNMRRISISPWANVDQCAEKLGNRYIFSWKPHPAHLATELDEDMIRKYVSHTLEVTRHCVPEIVLKDTHTCQHHPERFTRWIQIVRELVESR